MREPLVMMFSSPCVLLERRVVFFCPLTASTSAGSASQVKNSFHWSAMTPPAAPAIALISPISMLLYADVFHQI